eukprot:SAG11_NODE_5656_length_1494_cov_0.926165_1_plen_487_part_10
MHKKHGNLEETGKLVCQAIMPVLMLRQGGAMPGASIPKLAATAQKAAIAFLIELVQNSEGDVQIHKTSLLTLCQQMCLRIPDKSEFRQSIGCAITKFCGLLQDEHISTFTRFLTSYSKNAKALYRAFACDLSFSIFSSLPDVNLNTSACVNILKERASDKSPTVRAKALSNVVSCLSGARGADLLDDGTAITLFLALARTRVRDEKAVVRKMALQMLGSLVEHLFLEAHKLGMDDGADVLDAVDPADVKAIAERCRDSALNTRKAALQVLTGLLNAAPQSKSLRGIWLSTALPMIIDRQPSVVDLCCQTMHSVIIEPLIGGQIEPTMRQLAWDTIGNIRSPETRQFFHKVVTVLNARTVSEGKSNYKLSKAHVHAVTKTIDAGGDNVVGAWVLLEELAQLMPQAVNADLVWARWVATRAALSGPDHDADDLCVASAALRTLQCCKLSDVQAPVAEEGVLDAIRSHSLPPEVAKAAIECLAALTASGA